MAQLPPIPLSFTADLTQETKSFTNQFGDRQSQRFRLGRRPTKQFWSLRWELLTTAQKETLRSYFASLAGADPFQWTPPGQTTELNFVAISYKENAERDVWSVQIEAEQVYFTTTTGNTVLLFGNVTVLASPSVSATTNFSVSLSGTLTVSNSVQAAFAGAQNNLSGSISVSNDVSILPSLQANFDNNIGIVGSLSVAIPLATNITTGTDANGTVALGGFGTVVSTSNDVTATVDATIFVPASPSTQNDITATLDLLLGNATTGTAITATVDPSINLGASVTVTNEPTVALNWTPASFGSNLTAWYDFDDLATQTLSGSSITQITSKGNTRTLTSPSSTTQPTTVANFQNGRRVGAFNGSSQYLNTTTATIPGNSKTVFVAARCGSYTGPGATVYDYFLRDTLRWSSSGYPFYYASNDGSTYYPARQLTQVAYFVPQNTWTILGVRDTDTGNTQLWYNGNLHDFGANSDRGALTTNVRFALGSWADGDNAWLTSHIAEYIEVSGDISVADKERIEGYLAHKWGLTGNLPSGHPYKTSPP